MQNWESLRAACQQCQQCSLGRTRTHLVFGDGNPAARIMFIGEGPGQQEDLTGVPFVGPAGQLLDQMLEIIDLDRTKYYITNIVKCRPPHNRDPLREEQEACIGYLRAQTRLIDPRIIICLGRIAAGRLIHSDYRITREHGQWVQKGRVWMTAIYHPSALLRDVSKRPETFDDLIGIREKIRAVCPEVYAGQPAGEPSRES
ncbi:MAG TPA: uracil-DNA glycosylase [Candidatus Onthomonas avicola]|nr:uracil-DNA glycosylase [Candidatus Onthomonas avicola]